MCGGHGVRGGIDIAAGCHRPASASFFQEIEANLANDANVKTSVYVATVVWDSQEIEIAVLAMGRRPLLGTALLEGRKLSAEFTNEGLVTIEPLLP